MGGGVKKKIIITFFSTLFSIPSVDRSGVCKVSLSMVFSILNPCSAKLIYLIFQPLEVVSRYRDPQPQVNENYSSTFCLIGDKTFTNLDV